MSDNVYNDSNPMPRQKDPAGPLLNRTQLADYLGISLPTLSKLDRRGALPPYVRIGSRKLYRLEAVQEWLRRKEQENAKAEQPAWLRD